MFKLISATPSPYARKVRIALAEKGLPFELVTEVPWDSGTQTPKYNPLEKLPVLDSLSQLAGKPVAVHFHADWCPTCRAQEKVFNGWKGDAAVPGTLLVANYDNERELKKQYGVRSQSTIIVFKGSKETTRLGGETDAAKLRAALQTAQ